ncbi:MAG: magnesium chelatase subunit D [Xanthobacteraceae bacterium]
MLATDPAQRSAWEQATLAAALFAVDWVGVGGIAVRARPSPVRDHWLDMVRALLPAVPLRRVPHHVTDGRLLGGLDIAATLKAGRPVAEHGILHEADGGVLLLAMAERLPASTAARIGSALDSHEVLLERDGLARRTPSRFGVIMLDEGLDDERPPVALLDHLAFQIDLNGVRLSDVIGSPCDADDIAAARKRLTDVEAGDDVTRAICEAGIALGIVSIRALLLTLRVARAAAALAGRLGVTARDAALAASLVLAPRATAGPMLQELENADGDATSSEAESNSPDGVAREDKGPSPTPDRPLGDIVLEAAAAAIPADLLSKLRLSVESQTRGSAAGRAGTLQSSLRRGRPAGVRRGEPRTGARLNVIETLRAAAPWQILRREEALRLALPPMPGRRIDVRREDFHITRLKQRSETTSIFAVDASGSSALHRLAEVKGAVELLLADCYVRRDRVALLSFRGRSADLVLPPTRSLARAKRCLAGQPGGGGTPLAAAIDAAVALADAVRRKGQTPIVVLLTDGRANVARDGSPGREQAEADALASARMMRAAGFTALVIDTSSHPHPSAQRLAAEMGARYLPLPYADARKLSLEVQAAAPSRSRGR